MLGADELECVCLKRSERNAYLRPRLKRLGGGRRGEEGPGHCSLKLPPSCVIQRFQQLRVETDASGGFTGWG